MKTFRILLCALVVALGALASGSALAHGRVHFGFHFGGPFWYPAPYYYHPAPVYYYPPPVVYQQAPTYIERPANESSVPQSTPQSATDNSWYFCRDTQAYYPYVRECATPWQRVAPRPPGS